MKFTYETQGAITYLVCELDATEQIDSLTLGMLTNNHIQGLAPVLYTEMNGLRFLKYNISAKLTVEQFFSGNMNKQRTLNAFANILNAICSADEYMIDQNCFSVVSEHVFINISNCESALICVPVSVEKDINIEIASLFKKILFSTQFDQNEDASYITQLITYLNGGQSFNVYGLRDLVNKLQGCNTGAPQQSYNAPMSQTAQPSAPVSSFDSTISIDDMPMSMGGRKQTSQQPVQQVIQKPNQNPMPQQPVTPVSRPVAPSANTQPVRQPVQQSVQPSRPIQPVQAPNVGQQAGMRPVNKQPVSNGPGFAIPGKPMAAGATAPQQPSANNVNKSNVQPAAKNPNGEKKMSFFGLLANYSKENKAIYKAQKEEAKRAKAATSSQQGKPIQNKQQPVPPTQVQMTGGQGRPPMPQAQPSYTQPQYRPQVQPVPVQNSFNETTVLSPMMGAGETTVLSADPNVPNPILTRIKSGERISINKPVFRIGKEKSYVDYFIADNTAISRSHCNIHTQNDEYFIEDTNSTNHTYINGKIVTSNVKVKLSSGDKIRLANEDFTFTV